MIGLSALKPYLLLAAVAFAIGFVGYWTVARPDPSANARERWEAAASAPQSDEWNVGKRI